MKDTNQSAPTVSKDILNISPSDTNAFVKQRITDRSFSAIVATLNNDLLYGTPNERADAKKALTQLGFPCI